MHSLAVYAGPEGLCRTLAPLAVRAANMIEFLGREPASAADHLQDLDITASHCAMCAFQRSVQVAFIDQLSDLLGGWQGRHAYNRSQGVCRRHLSMLLRSKACDELRIYLLRQSAARCRALSDDMRSLVLKRTALRRDRLNEDEEDAARRFVTFMVRERLVIAPPSAR